MIHGFAQQSGGQVRVYSKVGQGTTTCLYLPRNYGSKDESEAPAEAAEAPRTGSGETVLVVDEPTVRMLIADALQELGYHVIEAEEGAVGLRVLRSEAKVTSLPPT